RALYHQSKVIILDEATSALDDVTEAEVMVAIDSLGREVTVIMVAHRLSTLNKCDQVINLKDGRVFSEKRLKPSSRLDGDSR
ncbi:lipid ABC transporter permease/ATP-binding protein, partial [Burkholderiales bacterium]|nr:lipid ABC transporter permease/ATP-binding protein [Burkholderiales bacterium]